MALTVARPALGACYQRQVVAEVAALAQPQIVAQGATAPVVVVVVAELVVVVAVAVREVLVKRAQLQLAAATAPTAQAAEVVVYPVRLVAMAAKAWMASAVVAAAAIQPQALAVGAPVAAAWVAIRAPLDGRIRVAVAVGLVATTQAVQAAAAT
nr:hypothetical protein [Comamonas serinivorans]